MLGLGLCLEFLTSVVTAIGSVDCYVLCMNVSFSDKSLSNSCVVAVGLI